MDPQNETATPETAPVEEVSIESRFERFLDPEPERQATPEAEVEAEQPAEETPAETQEEQPEQPAEQPRYKVKVRGEEREVPLDELLKGYSRTEDYKAKTAEVAERDRAIAQEREKIQHERNTYLAQLQQIVPALQQQIAGEFADIKTIHDVQRMAESDPARYVQWKAKQDTLAMVTMDQKRLSEIQQQEQQTKFQAFLSEQAEKLKEAEPIFGDPEKGPKEKAAVAEYLQKSGFTKDELGSVADHRAVLIARKAMLYDKLMAAKPQEKKVAAPPVKTIKPGVKDEVKPGDDRSRALRSELRKSGSIDAAAQLWMNRL